jgi:hypothetical protein
MTSCLVALAAGVVDTGFVPLLEREAQLASLREYAGEARRGDGRLVLIAGEAGAGKSALVEQLQQDLPEARWYWGACDGLFTHGRSGRCLISPPSWGRRRAEVPA